MKKLIVVLAALAAFVLAAPPSWAQQKCEGPPDLCAQIVELKAKVDAQKALADKTSGEKTAEAKAADKKRSTDAAKMVAFAATLAVLLKALLSALKGWKSYFKTDKGKAWLKVITVVVGFAAFVLTNIGFGIPWWQALIVAGGGPGSILVHELSKLIPVIRGKAPLPADEKDSDKPPAPSEDPKPEDPKA
jgi:hypothetical protein